MADTKQTQRILVIEDDIAYANVYQRKLTKEGYEVQIQPDGAKAMETVRSFRPNLILLDLVLPGKTGFEILQELRSDTEFNSIKIIVASNLSQNVDVEKAKGSGADDYFIKSNVSVPEMIQKVKSALE